VRDELSNLVGVAPLSAKCEKIWINLKTLEFIGNEKVCSEYLDFILFKEKESQCLELIFNYLISLDSWNIIDLFDMNRDSKNVEFLKIL